MKVFVTYSWFGGGGFDGFNAFGPVFLKMEDAQKWASEHEGAYHSDFDELEVYTSYVPYLTNSQVTEEHI